MDLNKLSKKKALLDHSRPLADALLRNLEDWFRVELTYTSNAIEGNTLSRRETALVVEKGLTVGGKSLIEHLQASNHARALDWIKTQIDRQPQQINEQDILLIHELVLKGIDDLNAGHYRQLAVRISGSKFVLPNPKRVPDLMIEFIAWLKKAKKLHAVDLAAEAHYRLVSIQPFLDGNGQTARLLMNLLLLMNGYPAAIIHPEDRLKYLSSLEQVHLSGSKEDYYNLIYKAVDRSLEIYLKALKGETETSAKEKKLLKIGQLAKLAGKNNSTIRHWTKLGLLEVADFTNSGYQLYSEEMLERIKEIKDLQEKRLRLEEIKTEFKKS